MALNRLAHCLFALFFFLFSVLFVGGFLFIFFPLYLIIFVSSFSFLPSSFSLRLIIFPPVLLWFCVFRDFLSGSKTNTKQTRLAFCFSKEILHEVIRIKDEVIIIATFRMCQLRWYRMSWENLTESAQVISLLRLFNCCLQPAYHCADRRFDPK